MRFAKRHPMTCGTGDHLWLLTRLPTKPWSRSERRSLDVSMQISRQESIRHTLSGPRDDASEPVACPRNRLASGYRRAGSSPDRRWHPHPGPGRGGHREPGGHVGDSTPPVVARRYKSKPRSRARRLVSDNFSNRRAFTLVRGARACRGAPARE